MKKNKKIGIIGNGFVGNAMYQLFSPLFETYVSDLRPNKSLHSLEETVINSDFIFVCVPTPESAVRRFIDLSILLEVFDEVFQVLGDGELTQKQTDEKVIVLKSTVIPGTTRKLIDSFRFDNIVFSPEFLTARTSVADTFCSNYAIIGSNDAYARDSVKVLYRNVYGSAYNLFCVDPTTAEFIKYMRNVYFASKVTLMNEFYNVAENIGINWEQAVSGFALDGRIAQSHLQVPGPDGKKGFGGACLPKDLSAFKEWAEENGIQVPVISSVIEANKKYRNG